MKGLDQIEKIKRAVVENLFLSEEIRENLYVLVNDFYVTLGECFLGMGLPPIQIIFSSCGIPTDSFLILFSF